MKVQAFVMCFCIFCFQMAFQMWNRLEVEKMSNQILRDQLSDYEQQIFTLKSSKTYEDGLADGVLNSKNIYYMAGYHAAIKQQNPFSQELEVAEQ